MLDRLWRGLALAGNATLLVFGMVLWVQVRPFGVDAFFAVLILLLILLNLWVIWQGPDREERKLRREVAKAELRQRLRAAEKE